MASMLGNTFSIDMRVRPSATASMPTRIVLIGTSVLGVPQPPRRPPVLNTLKDIGLALGICWTAHLPPVEQARPGMRVSIMLTFTKTGEILGEPRFTFVTREASPETRALYQRVAVAAIGTCTPLPFSEGLGNAVAGRPNLFPFVDWRNAKGA